MPEKSHFAGFSPPSNLSRWRIAQLQASHGEQVLLERLLRTIVNPMEYVKSNRYFKWVHSLADLELDSSRGFSVLDQVSRRSVPIVHLGYRIFAYPNYEGKDKNSLAFDLDNVLRNLKQLNRKVIAIGLMDENW